VTKQLIVLFLFTLSAAVGADHPASLTMASVETMLGKPGVYVFDVNPTEIWAQGHLPGAIHIDSLSIRRFLPHDKAATLIFYCANRLCLGSNGAAEQALRLGYRNVYVMPEGIFGWASSGRVMEHGKAQ